ncbi:hypothetical protein LEMLEM_LOCUS16900 [Lemmus lemmus]
MHHFFWEVPFGAKGNEEESPLALREKLETSLPRVDSFCNSQQLPGEEW